MNNAYPHLTAPLEIRGHKFRNRMLASPMMCPELEMNGTASQWLVDTYTNKAKGGCALVIVGETDVDNRFANRDHLPWTMVIDFSDLNSPFQAGFRTYADAIHSGGALAMIQLNHAGASKNSKEGDENPRAPMSFVREDGTQVVAMSEEEMEYTANSFATCAKFMQHAGFDGVQIHCGHGWMIHQFLSPRTNQRTDCYGGSRENRERFPLIILKAVRETVGDDFLIDIRISGDEHMPGGSTPEDAASFAKAAQQYVDMVHVSAGIYAEPVRSGEFSSLFHKEAPNADAAAVVRAAVEIPVSVVGGINSPDLAESLIADGKVDMVAIGRQLFADIDFAKKVMEGRAQEIRKCLRCFRCFAGPADEVRAENGLDENATPPLPNCSINPLYGEPEYSDDGPSGVLKNVLIIGGGVAGLQAAAKAAEMGHTVTLAEQCDSIGGVLKFTRYDEHKERFIQFCETLAYLTQKYNGRILLNQKVDEDFIRNMHPDAVVIAIGASPLKPKIPGLDGQNVVQAMDVYGRESALTSPVIVLGGGLVGCETALQLAEHGHQVTVVEMRDKLCPDGYKLHRVKLLDMLQEYGVECRTNTTCKSITKDSVTVTAADGTEETLPADSVVNALGMKENLMDAERLASVCAKLGIECHFIGDCVRPRKIYDAVQEGYHAGLTL